MFNVHKTVNLIEKYGYKKGKFCTDKLGVPRQYLDELERGKRKIENVPDDLICKIAQELSTTYEYLTDQTDNPLPTLEQLADMAETLEEQIVQDVMGKLAEIPEDRRETFRKLVTLPDDEFERAMDMLELLWKK